MEMNTWTWLKAFPSFDNSQKIVLSLEKTSRMELILVKLQAYSVQIAHYFQKMFQKLVFLKEHFSKRLCCSFVLIECVATVDILHFYQNQELTLDLTEEAPKIYPWWKLFFSKDAGLESFPAILLKTNSTTGIIWHWFCKVPFFNILENFLRGITVISFIQEVITLLKGLGLVS